MLVVGAWFQCMNGRQAYVKEKLTNKNYKVSIRDKTGAREFVFVDAGEFAFCFELDQGYQIISRLM